MTTCKSLREVGREVVERVARKVVLENDRTELETWFEMMRQVSVMSLAAGDLEGARKTAEANQRFALSVKAVADELLRARRTTPVQPVLS